ncbi:VQ motif-containing protein 25-like [Primulina huaijiensis]|uniref:VQ motif-containing protein 25-like n=1 Tax=Primulina huaijiensis TaxID=1492673 RepID=UPI003CC75130
MKPRIRIIHLFAPEIIEIDAANFREEVQRLTGKPADDQNTCKRSRVSRNLLLEPNISSANKRKLEVASMRAGLDDHDGIKGEGEIWREAYPGGGFLGRFSEIEYEFMQEIHKLTYVESTSRMEAYGPGSNPN